jgi:Tfp pilus assembly protein PilX
MIFIKHKQQGVVLPTVLMLALLCSVLLMAQWRNLGLAEGLGHIADQRWRLQLATHAALLSAVKDIQGPMSDSRHQVGSSKATHAFFPLNTSQWKTLQARLGDADCSSGICKNLGAEDNHFKPWLARWAQGQAIASDAGTTVVYWVEVIQLSSKWATNTSPFVYRITAVARSESSTVVASQALWHPSPDLPASTAVPMNLVGFKRLLQLSP